MRVEIEISNLEITMFGSVIDQQVGKALEVALSHWARQPRIEVIKMLRMALSTLLVGDRQP